MEKIKELWKKLNLKVAIISGVVVISTSLGTCHLMGDEKKEEPKTEETAPTEPSKEEVEAESAKE